MTLFHMSCAAEQLKCQIVVTSANSLCIALGIIMQHPFVQQNKLLLLRYPIVCIIVYKVSECVERTSILSD